MCAIETTGTLTAQGQLQLDHPLPQQKASRVRVIVLMPEEADLNEETWLRAVASNPSFAFLNDPVDVGWAKGEARAHHEGFIDMDKDGHALLCPSYGEYGGSKFMIVGVGCFSNRWCINLA
jgi:hypothetical protein